MDKPYIKTSNLNMASTLYALGIPIDGVYYTGEGEKMEFYFADSDVVRTAMKDYWDRKLRVEPTVLFWARKEIITRMKNEQSFEKSR